MTDSQEERINGEDDSRVQEHGRGILCFHFPYGSRLRFGWLLATKTLCRSTCRTMRAKELAKFVTYSSLAAFAFLCYAGVARAPQCCGNDHKWSLYEPLSGNMQYFWCTETVGAPFRRVSKKGRFRNRRLTCSEKMKWREACPWAEKTRRSVLTNWLS